MAEKFSTTLTIRSEPAKVWTTLTSPELMATWMGEPEMELEVHTDWKINSPIVISGFHHIKFENKGIVLQCDRENKLRYSHLSSISHLPDKPENYSILEFILTDIEKQSILTLNIENFPTETIRKHLEFYWRTTILKLKRMAEEQ